MKKEAERLLKEAQKSLEKGTISEAIELFEKYIKGYDRNDVRVLQKLADLYSQRTDVKNAIRCNLAAAKILMIDGFYSKVKVLLDKILGMDETNVEAITEKVELLKQVGCNDDARLLQYTLDELKAQAAAQTEKEKAEKEKAQRAIANAAVDMAIAKRQKGDKDAEKFLRELCAKINGALFPFTLKRKKSKK